MSIRFLLLICSMTLSVSSGRKFILDEDFYIEMEGYFSDLIITVVIPNKYYLALAFGQTHIDTDMLIFVANGPDSVVYDLYSTGFEEPAKDDNQDIEVISKIYEADTKLVRFEIERPLDTGDPEDFVFEYDCPISMSFATSEHLPALEDNSGQFSEMFGMHTRHGYFDVTVYSPVHSEETIFQPYFIEGAVSGATYATLTATMLLMTSLI